MRVTVLASVMARTDWSGASEPVAGFRIGRLLGRYWAVARRGEPPFAAFTTYEEAAEEATRRAEEDAWEERTERLNR